MSMRVLCAVLLLGGPASAQAPVEIDAPFEWRSLELAVLSPDADREICVWETILTVTGEGPLAGLSGRCLRLVRGNLAADRYEAEGHCVLSDGQGSQLAVAIERETSEGIAPPEGEGRWEGGTGRFAAAEGRFRFGLAVWGLNPEGQGRGTGRLRGEMTGLADAPGSAPALDLDLR